MITIEYLPGSSDPVHRHNAHGFVYQLEGSIVMQVMGRKGCDSDAGSELIRMA